MTTRACKNTKDKRTEWEGKVDVLICDTEVGNLTFLDLQFFSLSHFNNSRCPCRYWLRIDYNRMDDDLEEELDAAEYEKFDDAEKESKGEE